MLSPTSLKCPNFTFNSEHYFKVYEIAMELKRKPCVKLIFFMVNRDNIITSLYQPMNWNNTEQELNLIIQHANRTHLVITLT